MKKLLTTLLLGLMGLLAPVNILHAEEISLEYDPTEESEDDNVKHDNGRRQRMPPARILCEIDFESGSIEGSSPLLADIQSYEIWTEEGDACLFAGATAGEMTAALSGLGEGVYMLKLRGEGYVLIGFIER